jgi:hypothetical protein
MSIYAPFIKSCARTYASQETDDAKDRGDAYEEGMLPSERGEPQSSNPYSDQNKRDAWDEGWTNGEKRGRR